VEINGESWDIRTDFRTGVAFELTMLDPELSEEEKLVRALALYYPQLPDDIPGAISAAMDFYCCGHSDSQEKDGGAGKASGPLYDFEYDDRLIVAAFRQQYGIDLTADSLHWWTFRALLRGLTEETLFMRVVGWRGEEIDPKSPLKERERLAKLKAQHALPKRRSKAEQQKQNEIMQILMSGGDVSAILKGERQV